MCGICGFAGTGTLEDLRRMNAALVHRGPDAGAEWVDQDAAVHLGHRRLAIIDLADGAQPMHSNDGNLSVVFNGEIYNHLELRQKLIAKGHRFRTDHSDTEVLLHGYTEWGLDLPTKLNGMWAFALYDNGKGRLVLSRDRFGQKPLYYTSLKDGFAFASELSALTAHSQVSASLCPRSLKKYFAYGYVPAPLSLCRGIMKLPAGANLVLDLQTLTPQVQQYWDYVIEPFETIPKNAEAVWAEQLRELLTRSVERRLMADVPLGVFLSGGVDSSAIAGIAAGISETRTQSFTIGFQEASFDESVYAAQVAARFDTEHHLETLSMEKAQALLPELAAKLDEPFCDSSLLPTYLLCRETRKHVTVALSGDGADELFAGYDPFRALRAARVYDTVVPKPVHRAISLLAGALPTSHRNMSLDFRIKRTLRGLSHPSSYWCPIWLGPLGPQELEELFAEPIDMEDLYSEAVEEWDRCRGSMVDKVLQFYAKLYLQNDILPKTDRTSMMHSLEVRAPFLDIELVDFVRKIPHQFKYRNGTTKYILKRALAPLLPREILDRPKKGFGVPMGRWFQEKRLTFDSQATIPGLAPETVSNYLQQHTGGRADHRAFLWGAWLLGAHPSVTGRCGTSS